MLAPRVGFEPTTLRLTAGCSAVELPRKVVWGPRRPTHGRGRRSSLLTGSARGQERGVSRAAALPRSAAQVLLEERQRPRPRLARGVGAVGWQPVVHERVAGGGIGGDLRALAGLLEGRLVLVHALHLDALVLDAEV